LTGATLIIAKLDRLSRNVRFLFDLRESGVAFVALDMPDLNTLTLAVMAGAAQWEREQISARTRAALQAAKARGVRLGNPKGVDSFGDKRGSLLGGVATSAAADARARGLRVTIASIEAEGVTSANGIARVLNERGIATPRAGKWSARSVLNLQGRL